MDTIDTAAAAPGRPLNILIVDDSAVMRALIKRVARLADVPLGSIYEAANGAEAIKVLEAHQVDALFTDINMPVMNGAELLREVDSREVWKGLARIIVSTDGSSARRQELDVFHVKAYVEKPFDPEVMRDVLSDIASRTHA
jgi:two-component system chemotaxis response regulator CheY